MILIAKLKLLVFQSAVGSFIHHCLSVAELVKFIIIVYLPREGIYSKCKLHLLSIHNKCVFKHPSLSHFPEIDIL